MKLNKGLLVVALMWLSISNLGWSYTVSGNTYTTNGTQADVQAACSAAPDNGTVTVVIPNGTYSWTGNLTINKSLNLAGASATGVTINDNYTGGYMISATSSSNGNLNIYWLNIFTTSPIPSGSGFGELSCDRTEPSNFTVVVHDCTLDSNANFYFNVTFQATGIVMWNCNFPGTGGGSNCLTGILFSCPKYGYTGNWNTPDTWGTQDTTGLGNSYVENCSFANGSSSACNCEDNSRVVWRNNTMVDAIFSSHGQDSAPYGVREMEVYNNTFTLGSNSAGMNVWVSFNGGVGIAFNNSMQDIATKTGIQLNVYSINRLDSIPCQTGYPAARQLGQSWSASSSATYGHPVVTQDGTGAVTEGVYIWGNTGTETTDPNYVGINQFTPDQCGNGQLIGNYLINGRDYFVGTAKPGYTAYQYPHPLHTQYAVGGTAHPTPGAATNLRFQ